ncbi:MAG: signal peptidase I [Carnobacterium sp.]|uniref:Signal peptidase I n=1 Tax=Carnobacterium antarcticum TaxID=2126436 RepID=A0ABW4NQE6_9LACT|nr:signal peptidase I [Carnobacterium sp. CP1]ALV21268.1 Signal peptidase I [Carnobacterium sp. CP1]
MNKTTYSDGRDAQEEQFEPRRLKYNLGKKPKNKKRKTWLEEAFSTLLYVVIAVIIFLLIRHFLFVPVSVDGESMYPTLHDQDRLILNKIEETERFDLIVFPAPDDPEKQYIKRVIGMPGDEIMVMDETLYVNGEAVAEPYLEESKSELAPGESFTENFTLASVTGMEKVPENSYFVLGDNRTNSKDSRSFGFIDKETVSGTTDIRIWPLKDFGMIKE